MADILSQEEILSEYVEISPGILRPRDQAEMEEKHIEVGRSTEIPDPDNDTSEEDSLGALEALVEEDSPAFLIDDENVIEGIKGWLCDLHIRMDKVENDIEGLDEGLTEVEEALEMEHPHNEDKEDEMDPLAVEMLRMMEDEDDDDEPSQEQVDRMMEMQMLKAMEEEGGTSSELMDKLTERKAPVENTEEVEIELPEDVFMKLAYLAHERDVTLNQLVNDLLRETIEEE